MRLYYSFHFVFPLRSFYFTCSFFYHPGHTSMDLKVDTSISIVLLTFYSFHSYSHSHSHSVVEDEEEKKQIFSLRIWSFSLWLSFDWILNIRIFYHLCNITTPAYKNYGRPYVTTIENSFFGVVFFLFFQLGGKNGKWNPHWITNWFCAFGYWFWFRKFLFSSKYSWLTL